MASQGMFFGIFVLIKQGIDLFLDDKQPARMFYECLKQGIKNPISVTG